MSSVAAHDVLGFYHCAHPCVSGVIRLTASLLVPLLGVSTPLNGASASEVHSLDSCVSERIVVVDRIVVDL